MRVDCWFDPSCPWTWVTSRWLHEVQPVRHLDLRWRSFSLELRGGAHEPPDRLRSTHEALRVIEAARRIDEDAVGPLYTELGRRLHHDGQKVVEDMESVLEAVGADRDLANAARDASWDATIGASMDEALGLVGDEVGLPIVGVETGHGRCGLSGPVLSPAPKGEDAVRLFDALVVATATPGLYELKRSRGKGGPVLPPRP